MSLVWHIVRKDFRRMAVPLALWGVVLIAKDQIGLNLLHGDGRDMMHFDLMKICAGIALGVDIFVHVILVALLVHEDGLVGTQMFWATRPISGLRLFAAKALAAFLMFGVLPVVISLRWWLACSYGAGEIARAALVTLDSQMLTTLLALLLAALTESMGRYLFSLVGAFVALNAWLFALWRLGQLPTDAPLGVVQTRMALGAIVLVAAIVATILLQFCTRRRERALVLVVGILVASLVLQHAPWDWGIGRAQSAEAPGGTDAITVTALRARMEPEPRDHRQLAVEFSVKGIPADAGLRAEGAVTWRFQDGTVATNAGRFLPLKPEREIWRVLGLPPEAYSGPIHRVTSVGLRGEKSGWHSPAPDTAQFAGILRRQAAERLLREPATFSADLRMMLYRPVRLLELPARSDEHAARAGHTLRVARSEWRDGLLHVDIVESRPLLETHAKRRPGFATAFGALFREEDQVSLQLVELAVQSISDVSGMGTATIIGTQEVRWFHLALNRPQEREGARFGVLRFEPTDWVQRKVRVDALPLTVGDSSP